MHRVKRPDAPPFKDLKRYEVFGPTAIATNRPVPAVLESRCFPIRMPAAPGSYAWPDQQKGLELRERLLAWRAHNMDAVLPPPPAETTLHGRLRDICVPLGQVIRLIGEAELSDEFKTLEHMVAEIEEVRKEQDRDTLEGQIVQAVVNLDEEGAVQNARLAISDVRQKLGQGSDSRYWPSPQRVGHCLTALGFARTKDRRWLLWDDQLIEKLREEHGI